MMHAPVTRDVLLVGGGHSHALLIRSWAMRPLPGVRLTLVSDGVLTPYSGMLPGLVAGHYTAQEVHVDLLRLCITAGVRFINTRMTAIDLDARQVQLEGRPNLSFDLLSLDTGSTPDLSIPGAQEFSTPVKPVHAFHARWLAISERLQSATNNDQMHVGVVGSGAGGFEIAMAMHHALQEKGAQLHWFLRGTLPLGGRPERVRRKALEVAHAAGVIVHDRFDVTRVSEGPVLHAEDGREVKLDELLWCTGAIGPAWAAAAGFATENRGFISTDPYLRSISHPHVFATGDIGTQRDTPSPKAGVYAVRQAPYLYENLRRTLLQEPLKAYRPQHDFLSLMATGPKQAIASRGPFMLTGKAIWRLKDYIDREFMTRVGELPPMSTSAVSSVVPKVLLADAMQGEGSSLETGPRCRGCGAKVAGDLLDASLEKILNDRDADSIDGALAQRSDAAVFDAGGHKIVQSVDQLSALIDDPWLFSRISVRHALADVLTQGANPHSAQLMLTLPPAARAVQQRELDLILAGAVSALDEEGVALIGGHTAEGPELQIGLVVNGLAKGPALAGAAEAEDGDCLLLTRGLGSGVLFAGAMRARTSGESLTKALATLQTSQRAELDALVAAGARAITDVTGFGFVGHLQRLLATAPMSARIDVSSLPVLDGAFDLAAAGVQSSLYSANARVLDSMDVSAELPIAWRRLMADPQTAGGFLAVVPQAAATDALAAVQASAPTAALIGTLHPESRLTTHTFDFTA